MVDETSPSGSVVETSPEGELFLSLGICSPLVKGLEGIQDPRPYLDNARFEGDVYFPGGSGLTFAEKGNAHDNV